MRVQFDTPRGIVVSKKLPAEYKTDWQEQIIKIIKGQCGWIAFEDVNGDTVLLPENIIKESVISFIETGV
jgi:thiamine monophosphate kinase